MNSIELRHERQAVITSAKQLVNNADTEKRELNEQELEEYNKLVTRSEELKQEITKAERKEWIAENERDLSISERKTQPKPIAQNTTLNRRMALRAWLKTGTDCSISDQEYRAASECGYNLRAHNIELRSNLGDSSYGGNFKPTDEVFPRLVDALKAYGGMREVSDVISTPDGNPLRLPTADNTGVDSNVSIRPALEASSTSNLLNSSAASFSAFMIDSNIYLLPFEFIQDSAIDVESWVLKACSESIARKANHYWTVGAGTTEPRGVTIDAVLGESDSAYSADALRDFVASVDPAYHANCRFMMHFQTWHTLLSMTDEFGRSIFWNGSQSLSDGIDKRILGFPVTINQDMAYHTGKTILFGDFSYYKIREVTGVQLLRYNEKYQDQRAIGIEMIYRADGRLVNPASSSAQAPLKYFNLTGSV